MKLTAAQMEQYQREGYLFFPALFSSIEVKALKDEVPAFETTRYIVNAQIAAFLLESPEPIDFTEGVTATDLVLTIAEQLRRHGVVGRRGTRSSDFGMPD
jgi:hypothetical protein